MSARGAETVGHRTKQALALGLTDELDAWHLLPPLIIADSDYGNNVAFRTGLTFRGISWLVAVTGDTIVLPATGAPVTVWSRRRPSIHANEGCCGVWGRQTKRRAR